MEVESRFAITGYLNDMMQATLGNLPGLISRLARARNISSDEAIVYLQSEIRKTLESAERESSESDRRLLLELRAETDFLRKIYRDRGNAIAKMRDNVVQLRAEINFLRKSLSRARAERDVNGNGERDARTIERLESSLEKCMADLDAARRRGRESREEALRESENERSRLERMRALVEGRLNERERDLVTLTRIVYPQVDSPEEAVSRLRTLLGQYLEQLRIIAELTRARDEQTDRTVRSIDRLGDTLSEKLDASEELRENVASIAEAAERRETCEKRIAELQTLLGEATRREITMSKIREQLANARTENDEIMARIDELDANLNVARMESARLHAESREWQRRYEETQTELDNSIRQLKRSAELNEELERRVAELVESERATRRIRDLLQEAIAVYRERGGDSVDPEVLAALTRAYNGRELPRSSSIPPPTPVPTSAPTPSVSTPTLPLVSTSPSLPPETASRPPTPPSPKIRSRSRLVSRPTARTTTNETRSTSRKRTRPMSKPPTRLDPQRPRLATQSREFGVGPDYPSREFIATTTTTTGSSSSSSSTSSSSSSSSPSMSARAPRARTSPATNEPIKLVDLPYRPPEKTRDVEIPKFGSYRPTETTNANATARRRNAMPRRPPPSISGNRAERIYSEQRQLQRRLRERQRLRKQQQLERRAMRERLERQQRVPELEDIEMVEALTEMTNVPAPITPIVTPIREAETVAANDDILAIACRRAEICPIGPTYDISGEISSDEHNVIPNAETDEDALYAREREHGSDAIPLI